MTAFLKQGTNTVRVRVSHHRPDLFDITTWLVDNVGHSSQDTWIRYLDTDATNPDDWWYYDFKEPEVATLFALRWA